MRKPLTYLIFTLLLASMISNGIYAQGSTQVAGRVIEAESGLPLPGVNVSIRDRVIGTVTDANGLFEIEIKALPPFTFVFSAIGYETKELLVEGPIKDLEVRLSEQIFLGQEVTVAASRIEESILRSPVSVERMGIIDIQTNSAANFYDGLYQLKGVDMNVNSFTFRFPNTRGFAGESNLRMNQLIDGIENISPGLSFAAGNLFGSSDLDLESVEMLVGASSALYGPGGMNGTLLMTTKNPYDYQGLSFALQTGAMHANASYQDNISPMVDFTFRYAKAINDKFAFKVSGSYLQANDWNASDFRDRTDLSNPNLTRDSNPGYDGVNVYGDDIVVPVNLKDVAPAVGAGVAQNQGLAPGTPEYDALVNQVISLFPDQVISRTGWKERDLADYNTNNLKLSAALHYRLTDKLEAIAQGNFSRGTSLYTAVNRFSIRNFDIGFGKLELRSPDFFLRTWAVAEDSGDSFDLGGAALRLSEAWKPSEIWYQDYIGAFAQSVLLGGSEQNAHDFGRLIADNRDKAGNVFNENLPALPIPGTEEFERLFNQITNTPVAEGGAKVIDKSKLWHVEGMYDLSRKLKVMDVLVGTSYRIYSVNSEGTVFFDQPGIPINYYLFGAYTQISKGLWNEKVRITGSARYDKHEKFEGQFTPRVSMVYALDSEKQHNLRMSYQTAFRFPSTPDQWTDLDVGPFRSIGGLPEVQQKYNFDTNPVYPLSGSNPITDQPVVSDGPFVIPTFGPEKVKAMEIGYKGLTLYRMLFIDAYLFRNEYQGFIATQLLAQNPNTPQERRFQMPISTTGTVTALGWAIGADLNLRKGYYAKGNVAYNSLEEENLNPGTQSRFNTPDYRFNIGFGNRQVLKNLGVHLNYRWQNEFLWQSNFGEAMMPAFGTLDANVALKLPKAKSILKIGASNSLNSYYTTSFGSAQVGGLYYVTLQFDELLN